MVTEYGNCWVQVGKLRWKVHGGRIESCRGSVCVTCGEVVRNWRGPHVELRPPDTVDFRRSLDTHPREH